MTDGFVEYVDIIGGWLHTYKTEDGSVYSYGTNNHGLLRPGHATDQIRQE